MGHFKHSPQHAAALREHQIAANKKPKKVVQEGATRWTSTFAMLDRFTELYDHIKAVAAEHLIEKITNNLPRNPLQERDMKDVIKAYTTILRPFRDASLVA